MRFTPQAIDGVYCIDIEPIVDERGAFARVFCVDEFEARGLITDFAQSSVSINPRAGTLRGMHFSVGAFAETKLVRCTAGEIEDVLVDVRPASPTFGETLKIELGARNHRAIYIPAGVAHGFLTLQDDSEVLYAIDKRYVPEAARGLRFDDPIVRHAWTRPISVISERDASYPDFRPLAPQ